MTFNVSGPSSGASPDHADARAGWRLSENLGTSARWLAGLAVAASLTGTIVFPGVRGVASETTVVWWDKISTTFAIVLTMLSASFIFRGAYELIRPQPTPALARFLVAGFSIVAFAMCTPTFGLMAVPALLKVTAASATIAIAVVAAAVSARLMHTRAPAIVLGVLALTALTRLASYYTLQQGADDANIQRYHAGMTLGSIAYVFELLALGIAALWLATRGGRSAKLLVNGATAAALWLAWLGRGTPTGSDVFAIIRSAMTDASARSLPSTLPNLCHFLALFSPLLACSFVLQRRQAPLVAGGMALAILSRGSFDVPASVFVALASSIALLLAASDKQSLWQQLIASKKS